MRWVIDRIDDADFGCEERLPGEELQVLVTLCCEDGRRVQFEIADAWMLSQDLKEGDEWPEDPEEPGENEERSLRQAEWMEGYLGALAELGEGSEE